MNLTARGELERKRQAATNRLCFGWTLRGNPRRMAKTMLAASSRLPPYTDTFHTWSGEWSCDGHDSHVIVCNHQVIAM